MVNVGILVTDYDWQDDSRPILTIEEDFKSAALQIGTMRHALSFEISGSSPDDLRSQFEGFAEIFQKAAELIPEPETSAT